MSETEQHSEQDTRDDELIDAAVDLVLAMAASASTDVIRPVDWWPRQRVSAHASQVGRLRAALEVAAAEAESLPHMVSRMSAKLQIQALHSASSRSIVVITGAVAGDWPRFRELAQRDAIYITAMAQVERDKRREAKQ